MSAVSEDPDARILGRLRAAKVPVSGEELAELLGCSRAAVWKRIAALREEGYRIEARHAAGYVLAGTPDPGGAEGLRAAAHELELARRASAALSRPAAAPAQPEPPGPQRPAEPPAVGPEPKLSWWRRAFG